MVMGSKKGVIITVVVLVAITIGSFMVWLDNPSNTEMTIVVTDFENHDAGIYERHNIVSNAVQESFSEFMNEEISLEEYIRIAETSSSQNNALLMELASSDAPEEWQESYINYMNGMKKFNEYILETKVLANQIKNEISDVEILQTIDKIQSIKAESIEFIKKSNELRP